MIRVWDATTREIIMVISTNEHPVWCLAVSPMCCQIASGSDKGLIQVWNADTGKQSEEIDCGGSINTIAFDHDGRHLLSGSESGAVHVWELL